MGESFEMNEKTRYTDLLDSTLDQASEHGWVTNHPLFKPLDPDEVTEYIAWAERSLTDHYLHIESMHPVIRLAMASKLLFSLEEDSSIGNVLDTVDHLSFKLLRCNSCIETMHTIKEDIRKNTKPALKVMRDGDHRYRDYWHLETPDEEDS